MKKLRVNRNLKAGNISSVDAQKLIRLTQQLFHHIYDRYAEISEEGVGEEVDEALILDVDIIEREITERVTREVTEKVTEEVTQRVTKEVAQRVNEEVTQKVSAQLNSEHAQQLYQKEQEILVLRLFIQGKTSEEIAEETGLPIDIVEGMRSIIN